MSDRASKGGKARAAALTPEQRSESARRAVQARWRKAHQPTTTATTFSQPAGRTKLTTYEIRQSYGAPSPTGQVTTASSATWHACAMTRNTRAECFTH